MWTQVTTITTYCYYSWKIKTIMVIRYFDIFYNTNQETQQIIGLIIQYWNHWKSKNVRITLKKATNCEMRNTWGITSINLKKKVDIIWFYAIMKKLPTWVDFHFNMWIFSKKTTWYTERIFYINGKCVIQESRFNSINWKFKCNANLSLNKRRV